MGRGMVGETDKWIDGDIGGERRDMNEYFVWLMT